MNLLPNAVQGKMLTQMVADFECFPFTEHGHDFYYTIEMKTKSMSMAQLSDINGSFSPIQNTREIKENAF